MLPGDKAPYLPIQVQSQLCVRVLHCQMHHYWLVLHVLSWQEGGVSIITNSAPSQSEWKHCTAESSATWGLGALACNPWITLSYSNRHFGSSHSINPDPRLYFLIPKQVFCTPVLKYVFYIAFIFIFYCCSTVVCIYPPPLLSPPQPSPPPSLASTRPWFSTQAWLKPWDAKSREQEGPAAFIEKNVCMQVKLRSSNPCGSRGNYRSCGLGDSLMALFKWSL